MVLLYTTDAYIAANEQMHAPRATWKKAHAKLLLDICQNEKNQYNWCKQGPSKEGWRNVYQGCRDAGLPYEEKQIRNKLTDMKKNFLNWQTLQNKTGLGRDPTTGAVVTEDLAPNHTEGGSHEAVMSPPFPLLLCTNPNMWSYLSFSTNPNIWLPLCRNRV